MNLDHFGVNTITLAGGLEGKLRAVRDAGFAQVVLPAQDIVGHPGGEAAALAALRASGLRPAGLQALRDFEGLEGHLHAYKVDIAKAMLDMCRATGARLLIVSSSTSSHSSGDTARLVRDLRKLATLAVPYGVRIAYEALSWGRHVNEPMQAWDIVAEADRANLGLVLDSFHLMATKTGLDALEEIVAGKIFLVQLSDFMWQEIHSREEGITTATHFRVFPGEGMHGDEVVGLVRRLDRIGYRGDYSFEVFNDDYMQLPPAMVAARARRSVKWVTDQVSHRSLPPRRLVSS
jgi:sugar phosphate isomerase/epimerase